MFVFPVPRNRPKEERKARFCVTATPRRAAAGGAGRPHAPNPGMLAPGGHGSRPQGSLSSQGSGSLPTALPPAEPPRASPAAPRQGEPFGGSPRWLPPGGSCSPGAFSSPLTPQPGPAAAADLWQDFCSGREGGGAGKKKAIDFNRISPQTLLVCCCYASIWRSLFINERVRSVAKTLRARICVIKLRAG